MVKSIHEVNNFMWTNIVDFDIPLHYDLTENSILSFPISFKIISASP